MSLKTTTFKIRKLTEHIKKLEDKAEKLRQERQLLQDLQRNQIQELTR